MKAKTIIRSILNIIIILITVLLMLFFSMMSPYELWDTSVKQIDPDKLLVLRLFWGFISATNMVLTYFTKSHKKIIFVIYFILTFISLVKFISLAII